MKLFDIYNPLSLKNFIKRNKFKKGGVVPGAAKPPSMPDPREIIVPLSIGTRMSLQNTENPDFKFFLGDRAKDLITGFEGIINSRCQYLTNCNTYGLKSTKLKDDKPMETQWFDEPHIVLIKEKVHQAHQETGGPTDAPKATNREQ